MTKQRDIAALRDAVQSSEFTPAVRDLGALVELLGEDDEDVARGAERAILRADGPVAAKRVLAELDAAGPAAAARALRILGTLAPKDAAAGERMVVAVRAGDPRVRRAAAHALGRLNGSEAAASIAQALVEAWDETPELPLARAIAEAMGKLGLVDARGRLESVLEGDAELARIARKALAMLQRDETRHEESRIAGERAGAVDLELILVCRPGLEKLMMEELAERCPSAREVRPCAGRPGEVSAIWRGALDELMTIRTMLRFAFALPIEAVTSESDTERACVRALTSEMVQQIVSTWTQGAVRYRVDWEGKGHRRAATWRLVEALRAQSPAWTNDPTESTWQFSIDVADRAVCVLLEPRKLDDPRFAYRVRDVPAASHPTIAAALVRASRPMPGDVVWDPFAGSGSELIERSFAGPYATLIGSDTDPSALDAARANLDALKEERPEILFELGDATTHAPPGVNAIITNPPMGRRVARDGSLATLLDAFTEHAARVLVPGGRLVWLSPLGGRTAERAEANNLRVSLRQHVDMGGFQAELQVWNKPTR